MSVVKILQYPDKRLYTTAPTVHDFGSELQQMVDDMLDTYAAAENCAALAATQLDFQNPKRVTVVNFSVDEKDKQVRVLVNPEIVSRTGEQYELEGCMSVGLESGLIFERVRRAQKISVRAQDRHGALLEFEVEGFMAKCIQHEIDHLEGKLFISHLSSLKRNRIIEHLLRHEKK